MDNINKAIMAAMNEFEKEHGEDAKVRGWRGICYSL